MKIINKSRIPDALFRYLAVDHYDHEEKGDSLSATELLNPIQIIVLNRRYFKDIVVDAIDRLWIMLGNGVHKILEEEEGIEKIERLKVKVCGRDVSGRWDRIFDNRVTDYKITSAWTVVYGSRNEEWRLQLSIYRWLYYKVKGILLDKHGSIVALLRDWSEKNTKPLKSGLENNYPKAPAVEISFSLLSTEDTQKFIEDKVKAVTQAEKLKDDKLPGCTDEERWLQKSGVYTRCEKYCNVATFCKQWKGGK